MPAVPAPVRFAALGALGGCGSFVFSRMLEVGPFIGQPVYYDLPAEIMLGAFAALFGVFLLTASDVESPRTLVFALACGLFWSPIIAGTQSFLQQHADGQTADSAQAASTVAGQIQSKNGEAQQQAVTSAAAGISNAMSKLPQVTTPDAREKILNSSAEVVKSIPTTTATSSSVAALQSIGLSSAKAQASQVSLQTFEKLRLIAVSSTSPQTRSEATAAAAEIAKVSPAAAALQKSAAPKQEP